MRKRDNIKEVRDMGKMLSNLKHMMLENYILPEENDSFEDEIPEDEESFMTRKEPKNDINGIEKELTQIRKIALGVINRLADQPTSQQYDTMKKIWNMVDKAIESKNTEGKNNNFDNM